MVQQRIIWARVMRGDWIQLQDSLRVCFKLGLGIGLNNQAELLAAGILISIAQENDITEIEIFSDSMIILGWLLRSLQMSSIHHQASVKRISEMESRFQYGSFSHVYREKTVDADSLAKAAVDLAAGRVIVDSYKGDSHHSYSRTIF
jgi:ribonuclease HI